MAHSRIGYCNQCGTQIMVRDAFGKWSSFKTNYAQIDLEFNDGHKMRVALCKTCAASPNYSKIKTAIFHDKSEALNKKSKDFFIASNHGEIKKHALKG